MLLDDYLPQFDVQTHQAVRIAASPERVYACLKTTNSDQNIQRLDKARDVSRSPKRG